MIGPDILAILLGLFSAVTVAAVNFGVKRGGDVLVTRMVMSVTMALTVLPFVPFVAPLPRSLWPAMMGALGIHALYQIGLVNTLQRGELSRVFPLMRGAAPLLVAILAVFALKEYPSPAGWAGLALASAAVIVFTLPDQASRARASRRHDNITLLFAVWTALGIAAYTVADAAMVRQSPSPFTYIVYLILLDWVGVACAVFALRRGRIRQAVGPVMRTGMVAGVLGTLSFSSLLYALSLADAAIVTALRETSVVWAAAMGAVWLREGLGRRRIIAASILAAGLIIMQVSS